MADEDIPDYLSDEFIIETPKNDIRPGLLHSRVEKRKHEQRKRQELANKLNTEKHKGRTQLEEENRQKALQKEIPADNKGFQLLQKMGYKPGSSLGNGTEGIKTPISVEVKANRKGLGHTAAMKEKRAKLDEINSKKKECDLTEFRLRIQLATTLKETQRDLYRAQLTCRTLDMKNGTNDPIQKWFWPEIPKPEPDDDDEIELEETDKTCEDIEEDPPPEDHVQLQSVVSYLRKQYFYCIWCGATYDSLEDLVQTCPGDTRDDH